MKHILLSIISIFVCLTTSGQQMLQSSNHYRNGDILEKRIDSIVIKQAPWHIMTVVDVTCSDFEDYIPYKEYCISDSIVISDIVKEINILKASNGKTLNVRCKIYFYSHGQAFTTACFDPGHVLYDGALYSLSLSLKNKIDSVTKNNTPKKHVSKELLPKRDFPFPNGRDSLYAYLLSASGKFVTKIEKTIALTVICQIDSQGNTIKVIIKNKDKTPPTENEKDLFAKLTEFFMNDIKWIPDKERFPFEVIGIPLRLMAEGDS